MYFCFVHLIYEIYSGIFLWLLLFLVFYCVRFISSHFDVAEDLGLKGFKMCDSIDEVQESIFYSVYLVIHVHHYSHVYGPNDIALQGFIWNCITLCSCGYLLHIASIYSHKEKRLLSPLHSTPNTCKALVFGNILSALSFADSCCFVNV